MPRYADPSRCPDCSAALPAAPGTCPSCGLPLTGALAAELLRTLRRADNLVGQLRVSVAGYPPPDGATNVATGGATNVVTGGASGSPDGAPTGWDTAGPRGLTVRSVPRILLTLGALCLLVAAVIFLAVAWSWLGIAGRTTVLVALTATAGFLGVRFGRTDLRVAAEALVTVALGLLLLDLAGAQDAGWLGGLEGAALAVLVGVVLATAGALLLLALPGDRDRLVAPQVAVVVGLLVAGLAVHDLTDRHALVLTIAVLVSAAVVRAVRPHRAAVVVWGVAATAGAWWSALLLQGAGQVVAVSQRGTGLTWGALWADGEVVPLAVAAILALVPVAVVGLRPLVLQGCLGTSGVLVTIVVLLPTVDSTATGRAVAWLTALLLWTAVAHLLAGAPHWSEVLRRAVLAPLAVSASVVAIAASSLVARALDAVLGVGSPYSEDVAVRLAPREVTAGALVHPLMLLALTAALLAATYVALPWRRWVDEGTAGALGLAAMGLAALGTLAQYAVPLGVVVAILAPTGVALVLDASRRLGSRGAVGTAVGAALLLAASVVALRSAVLAAAALGVVVLVAATLLAVARSGAPGAPGAAAAAVSGVAGAVLPLAWAGFVWSAAEAIDLGLDLRAYPVIVVAGLLAIVLHRVEVEAAAAVAAALLAPIAVGAAGDGSVALALHLTLAGALVTASSLIHGDRRVLALPGGLLLAAATWVRLADLGVTSPEAYTLPTALVLVALGLYRLRRQASTTTGTSLLPGLVLATVPSLLWVLGDPVSLRALLLGAACLVLVIGAVQVRWGAPLLVGAGVGAILVLRELAPYVAQTPQWLAIGLAGAVLTVIGVTWEKRLQDLQVAGGFLGRLR